MHSLKKLSSPHISYYFNEDGGLSIREGNRSLQNRHLARDISIVIYRRYPKGKELLPKAYN